MATGYEVEMYNNIKLIKMENIKQTKALESIAASLEKLANPPQTVLEDPPDTSWVVVDNRPT